MNTSIELRVKIAKVLPGELQEVVWRRYYDNTVLPWLMVEINVKLRNNDYEELYTRYHVYVVELANRLCSFYRDNQLWFNMNMDFAEDRLLDVVFTMEGRELFDMYLTIKENISHSYLLRLGLIGMIDQLRKNGRDKLHACILCNAMLQRLKVMILPDIVVQDEDED